MRMKAKKLGAPRLLWGVGINDADYAVQKWEENGYENGKRKKTLIWTCPFYRTWKNMLMRCYSIKYQDNQPTYRGCSVTEEWKRFSNFKRWMERQDWEGKQLDKDLLMEGNKSYSPEACVFVTRMVNSFTTDRGNGRGELLIGVHLDKGTNKFRSQCSNPFTNKGEHLGYFGSEQDAHKAWLKRKLELAKELAAIQPDPRVAEVLIKRYTNYKQK